jgi:hypothetical protein
MPDGLEALAQKVEDLTAVATRLDLNTQKLSWVLSDENVGLIGQVRALALVVGGLKETRDDHEVRIKALQDRHTQEDKDAAEARKPIIAMGWSIAEKFIWTILLGVITWLGYLVAIRK